MPPAPVKIERIAGDRTRQNTFHKRKLGLIKKAIELTVLCDCDIGIIIRSGPSITCPDGKISAYCNRDLDTMITHYMAEPPEETYNNAEYSRLAKGDIDSAHYHHPCKTTVSEPVPSAPMLSVPAIEIDVAAGTHAHAPARLKEHDRALRQRLAEMEAELQSLRFKVQSAASSSSSSSSSSVADAAPQQPSQAPAALPSKRKHSPPPLTFHEQAHYLPATSRTRSPAHASGGQLGTFEERDSKRARAEEADEGTSGALLTRELSWDFGQLFAGGGTLPVSDSMLSPFNFLNAPLSSGASQSLAAPLSSSALPCPLLVARS